MQLHGLASHRGGIDLQGAFSLLARNATHDGPLDDALRTLTEAVARMLIVERVSLWALAPDHSLISCLDLYELTENRHSSGMTLSSSLHPAYFEGLRREEAIVADDAATHPYTHEMRSDYLLPNNITAILDTPIHARGELQGVLCIEQVGPHGGWTPLQRMFAAGAANLVSLALLQHEARSVRDELNDANQRLRALFEASGEAIVIARADDGVILDLNPAAERLFGCARGTLIGQPQTALHPADKSSYYRRLFTDYTSGRCHSPLACEVVDATGRHIEVEISATLVLAGHDEPIIQGIFRPLPPVIG